MSEVEGRIEGTVKWFNQSKGYGFITQEKGSDVFVHFSAIEGTGYKLLREGDHVEFKLVKKDKGLQAENVIVLLPEKKE
jgi:CspA family cold shock protein